MKAPTTYSEWMDCFDTLKSSAQDYDLLNCLHKGTIQLTPGIESRFVAQLSLVIKHRLTTASTKFSRILQTNTGDINILSSAMLSIRKELNFLLKFSQLPVVPSEVKIALIDLIKEHAKQMQKAIESETSRVDRTGMLTSLVKKNKIDKLDGI